MEHEPLLAENSERFCMFPIKCTRAARARGARRGGARGARRAGLGPRPCAFRGAAPGAR
jgi:hypothetical protein